VIGRPQRAIAENAILKAQARPFQPPGRRPQAHADDNHVGRGLWIRRQLQYAATALIYYIGHLLAEVECNTSPSMKRLVTSEYGLAEPAQRLPCEIDKRDLSSFVRHHGSSSSISRGRSISARATARLTLTIGSQPTYKLRPYQNRTFVIGECSVSARTEAWINWSSISRMEASYLGERRLRRCSETGMSA
jgi:hypothetical protein